ncbi:hypothetical protein ACHAXT_001456 [Thalassiosira profunda]
MMQSPQASASEQYLQQLEGAVLAAASGSADASRQLDAERCKAADGLAAACLQLLGRRGWGSIEGANAGPGGVRAAAAAQYDAVAFYALTTLQRSPILSCLPATTPPGDNFAALRGQLRSLLLTTISCAQNITAIPQFVVTKIGVLLALLVREEYPSAWASPFGDVLAALNASNANGNIVGGPPEVEMARMGMYLSFLDAVSDEIVDPVADETNTKGGGQREQKRREQAKDAMRGYLNKGSTQNGGPLEPCVRLEQTDAANVVGWLFSVLTTTAQPGSTDEALAVSVRSAATMKRYLSWIDLRLAMDGSLDRALLSGLGGASAGNAGEEEPTQRTLLAVECANCLREIVDRGMDEQKKLALLTELDVFGTVFRLSGLVAAAQQNGEGKLDLVNEDGTQIEAVAAAAELINAAGLALIQGWEMDPTQGSTGTTPTNMQMQQCLELVLACLAYDSIDVSGAVIGLVSRIMASLEKKEDYWNRGFSASIANGETTCNQLLSRILLILHLRMKYPADFEFDYEDEEEAEEELYRTSLRKLYQRIVRLRPQLALQFVGQCLSSLPQPLSSAPTPDIEVALRLIYHYGEGRRPAPGAKSALKDPPFREMAMALHRSDVSSHPHREVLLLYYDLSVRYSALLKESPELLTILLGSLSGDRGLQHSHTRVRCRCCYLLLRLIKGVGAKAMLPHVEPVVDGVQKLLFPPEPSETVSIPSSEALYLFEATGLLLGTTGLDTAVQVRCAAAVLTPHIRSIEQTLQNPDLARDVETYGESLSLSISAIAQLSKGWTKHPPPEVQAVLEAAVDVCRNVVTALPASPLVRNRTAVLLQRMILCLGERILPAMPSFFSPLLANCTLEDDVLDVSQLINQLCIKFKEKAAAAIDSSLMPFLQSVLAAQLAEETSMSAEGQSTRGITPPPHLITEQLSVRKQAFATLQHIALHDAHALLWSETNLASLGDVLQLMNDGATTVPDPVMKKTCCQFFCELISSWGFESGNHGPVPPQHVSKAFFDFAYEAFVPGMVGCILAPTFNVKDALSSRVVAEVARALWYLKQSDSAGFQSRVIEALVVNKGGSPDGIAVGFQNATSAKDAETVLKAWKEKL